MCVSCTTSSNRWNYKRRPPQKGSVYTGGSWSWTLTIRISGTPSRSRRSHRYCMHRNMNVMKPQLHLMSVIPYSIALQVIDESKKKIDEICYHQDAVRGERDSSMVKNKVIKVRRMWKKRWHVRCLFIICDNDHNDLWQESEVISCCLPQPFHAEYEVENYPLKEVSEKEGEDLRRVENLRKTELAACKVSATGLDCLWFGFLLRSTLSSAGITQAQCGMF